MSLLIIELGRRIQDEAKRQFPDEAPVRVISYVGEIDVPGQAQEIARDFCKQLEELHALRDPIKVVISGPGALNFIFGMLVGLNHYNLEIFHYDALLEGERYRSLGRPSRDWLARGQRK